MKKPTMHNGRPIKLLASRMRFDRLEVLAQYTDQRTTERNWQIVVLTKEQWDEAVKGGRS